MPKKHRKVSNSQVSKVGRHEPRCKICSHPRREEIEAQFTGWISPADIARDFKLGDRSSVYRHAHATGLFAKRDRNVRAGLGRLIERIDYVKPTASAIVQAIALLARINARGELVERSELPGRHELYSQMNRDELLVYATSGTLPAWFRRPAAANETPASEGENV